MSHVPFENAWMVSFIVAGLSAFLLAPLQLHMTWVIVLVLTALAYVLYSYSPLPQGWRPPNTPPRKRKWGFEVEYLERLEEDD